ncbi:hypothetical protein LZ199_05340 [Myxococcus sp. QH3KD-4-1]|nr:hypothetical protein [Myxococcus qinghaiensis]
MSEERLLESLSRVLGLPPGEVTRFDLDSPCLAAVLVQRVLRPAGFRTDLTLYVDASRVGGGSGLTSEEVATRVSAELGEEVLVSPPADDPAVQVTWFLITPEGKRFRVSEVLLGDEEYSVDIDRASLRPL